MAQVKTFELLHGIVLTKLARNDKEKITLRLIETDTQNAWAAYIVNDEITVYIKYSLTKRETKREKSFVWTFPFQPSELEKVKKLRESKNVYAALVCGLNDIKEGVRDMQVCLLDPDQIDKCIDVNLTRPQTVSVTYKPGNSLRAYGANMPEKDRLVISRNKLDEWKVPGS